LIGYGLSGIPFCSHDVGGFDYSPHFFDDTYNVDFKESYNDSIKDTYPKDAEVYIRWLQVGVFSSHIRAHGKQAREPWTYGEEAESISKKYLKLRYRLLPYIYSQAVISSRTGLPMVRPMLLEFQEDRNTQRLDLQYMFGESFLVAPVFTHEHIVDVYLPDGTWIDYWTKEMIEGGIWLKVDAPLETLPLWVREGSIIPYGPDIDFVEQEVTNKRTIEIFAPIRSAETIIEDEDRQSIHVSYQKTKSNLFVNFEQNSGETQLRVFGLKINSAILDGNSLALNSIHNGYELSFEKNGLVQIICEIGEGQDD
jgi:alpha-D-xyloside xylohydrolase